MTCEESSKRLRRDQANSFRQAGIEAAMKFLFGLLFFIAVGTNESRAAAVGQQPRSDCLAKVESRLGKPATNEAPVYGLTTAYAMEIEFGRKCEIVRLRVGPKYGWEMQVPDWTEPHSPPGLNANEYAEVLTKINQLRSVGALISKGDDGAFAVTNSKEYHWDEYESAVIERVMHCCDNKSVFSFRVYFFQEVAGEITQVLTPGELNPRKLRSVKINNESYLISSSERVVVGERGEFRVVGPMD